MPEIVHRLSSVVNRKEQSVPATKNELRKTNKRGFTLIELMVVIAIMAILAAVGLVVYSTAQKSGRVSKRVQDLSAIRTAVELYKSANGKYPSPPAASFQCLTSLTGANALTPTYMVIIPNDPQDSANCYQYYADGTVAAATATSNEYKVRTHPSIPTSEMGPTEYRTQPVMVDPDRDGSPDDNCVVTTNVNNFPTGWSVQSGSATACNWP